MVVRLRAHHLLCVLTYVGKGYSSAFVAGYDRVIARLAAGEEAEVVAGPDEVCAPLAGDADRHCDDASTFARDARAAAALAPVLGRAPTPGARFRLDSAALALLRGAVAEDRFAIACAGCPWLGLCRSVADGGFAGVRLAPAG